MHACTRVAACTLVLAAQPPPPCGMNVRHARTAKPIHEALLQFLHAGTGLLRPCMASLWRQLLSTNMTPPPPPAGLSSSIHV